MSSPMLEVRHLKLVRAIADEGGPTRAAARLHLSQSAVSHQLAELEGRLGVQLFARVQRKLTPTVAGARLIEEARSLLSELARVERDLHREGARKREVVNIVTESFTSYPWFPTVVAALAEKAPHIELRIALSATREPVAALLRGTVDVAIVSSPVRDRALVSTPMFADEWTVLLGRDHRLARRTSISATELGQETLIAQDAPRADVERLRDILAAERAPMPRVVGVPLTSVLVDCVRAGLGIGLVSKWAVATDIARGDVVARRFTKAGLPEQWVALTRRDAAGKSLDLVIELVKRAASPAARR
ncbi:MAG: LysR family transcriptional regulator [Polyangiaceae bacterium]|nr:LysR family transcriptional regulator [Polyangiaceae bacterium]